MSAFHTSNLERRHKEIIHSNLPTTVVDKHSIAATVLDTKSKGEVKCFGFLHWPTVTGNNYKNVLVLITNETGYKQARLARWLAFCSKGRLKATSGDSSSVVVSC